MRLLPRRTRGNVLLAAISSGIVFFYIVVFTLFDDDANIRNHDDLDEKAFVNGGKMKILPAQHSFRKPREVKPDQDLNVDAPNGEVIDFESLKQEHKHQNVKRKVIPENPHDGRPIDYDENEEDDDDAGDVGRKRIVQKEKKPDTFVGDFHRIIEENKDILIEAKDQGANPGIENEAPEKFLSFNRYQVQHCITHDIIGHVHSDVHSEPFRIPDLQSFESNNERKLSFGKVFLERAWGKGWDKAYDRLDASGRGAQLSWAQEVIATLHRLIDDLKMATGKKRVKVLDLPCGDMAWMSRFLVMREDVDYTGIDIVPELISNHRKAYRSYPWKFRLVDVLQHPLQESFDLIINRMLLQHLYYKDVFKLLKQFSETNSSVLFTTTFLGTEHNSELDVKDNPGRVRKLNLEIPPLSLSPPLCVVRDGPPDTFEGWDHFIAVWRLPLRRLPQCLTAKKMTLKGTDKAIFSCVDWSVS